MLKSKFGPITNPKTGKSKDIMVKFLTKENDICKKKFLQILIIFIKNSLFII